MFCSCFGNHGNANDRGGILYGFGGSLRVEQVQHRHNRHADKRETRLNGLQGVQEAMHHFPRCVINHVNAQNRVNYHERKQTEQQIYGNARHQNDAALPKRDAAILLCQFVAVEILECGIAAKRHRFALSTLCRN
ncbi:Uncharacterised protein [Chlamydia trachomatis]|nr:Uncharacterised protein [Chlamydia trachomatis]